jgi:predicted aspartyl protease
MGTFYTRIGVANPEIGEFQWVDPLVDTGALYTMLLASFLDQTLRLSPSHDEVFRQADGTMRRFALGEARFKIGDREFITPVVFGPEGRYLLGAITLQVFALMADTTHHKLIPVPELTL